MLEQTWIALGYLGDSSYWVFLLAGVGLAIMVGITPGVGSLLTMAILIPFLVVNVEDAALAIILLAAITGCNNTLDSIPAVVIGLPSSATQVTFLEGHQLARKGKAAHTLGAIYAVSAIGGVTGAVILAVTIPIIRPFVLEFSYGEIAVMAMFGVFMVAVLSRGAVLKGLCAGLIGLLLGTVGSSAMGAVRYTFGQISLWGGLPVIATISGFFALPEIIDLCMTQAPVAPAGTKVTQRDMFQGFMYGLKRWKMAVRQSVFGVIMGAIPGVGSGQIDWLAYAFGMIFHKNKAELGKGSLDGVLYAESAQNAKEAGQAIPTLAMGIPGGTGWIMILAAMMIYGVIPGPEMLGSKAHVTILIVITLALGNLLVTMIGLVATIPVVRLTTIPYPSVAAVVIPLSFLAAYMSIFHWHALVIFLVFAVLGWVMKAHGWPRPPLILAFILSSIMENNLASALAAYGLGGVLSRPIVIVLLLVTLTTVPLLFYFMNKAEKGVTADDVAADDVAADDVTAGAISQERRLRLRWPRENWLALFMCGMGVYAAVVAAGITPVRAGVFPLWISIGIAALAAVILVRNSIMTVRQGSIMDLGMRSKGVEGAGMVGLTLIGLLALMLLVSAVFGLPYGVLVFAILVPLLLLKGRVRLITLIVAPLAIGGVAFAFMDYYMAVIWPPRLLEWLPMSLLPY